MISQHGFDALLSLAAEGSLRLVEQRSTFQEVEGAPQAGELRYIPRTCLRARFAWERANERERHEAVALQTHLRRPTVHILGSSAGAEGAETVYTVWYDDEGGWTQAACA